MAESLETALIGQYLSCLAMLRQSVERCPNDVWLSGVYPRKYWRIAYHAVFFAHLYLVQNEEAFCVWKEHRQDSPDLWGQPEQVEPYSQAEVTSYIDQVRSMVEDTIRTLDIEAAETGFPWYPNMSKLEHEIMSIRHVQGHVGQLSEILMSHGIEIDWIR